jgi:VanZ family protein
MFQLGVSTYYSLMPAIRLGTVHGSDKLWHLAGYLLLALPIPFLWDSRRSIVPIGFLLALYGVALEFGQAYVPGRSFELADMAANTAGVALGLVLSVRLRGPLLARRWKLASD